MSRIFVSLYSDLPENEPEVIPLCPKFCNILVTPIDKDKVFDELERCTDGSLCMRKVVNILIADEVLIKYTGKDLLKNFSNLIDSAYELVKEKDQTLKTNQIIGILNSLIQDTKKKYRSLQLRDNMNKSEDFEEIV